MLRGRLSDGTFIMGLDRTNIERLVKGEPIAINLVPMGGSDVVIITFGETLADVQKDWEAHQGGRPLPTPQPWDELIKKGN
jgi:hypothetical protein